MSKATDCPNMTEQSFRLFDIFICCEKADPNGKGSRDSTLGESLYYFLAQAGYKVFCEGIDSLYRSRADYQEHWSVSINSARVMLVVGAKPESFMSERVMSAWEFYIGLLEKNSKGKCLIPCYCDMDERDLPLKLSHYRGLDLGQADSLDSILSSLRIIMKP